MERQRPTASRARASREVDGDPKTTWRRVSAIAAKQKGNVGRDQLLATGLTGYAIDNWVKSGRLILKYRGVYRLGHEAVPEFSDELAAVMACGRGAMLSHRSAAYLWRVLPTSPSTGTVSVLVANRDLRSRPGIRARRTRSLLENEVTRHRGIPVTTPARTILDLAAEEPIRTVERALNEAHVLGLARPSGLIPLIAQHPRHRGAKPLRTVLQAASDHTLTRSEAERRFLDLVRLAKLPPPRVNARVGRFEVDFLWPEQRVIVEVDGFRFHSSRAAFERDRAKWADLSALGYTVIPVTWRQIAGEPHALVARIAQALAAVGLAD
jgi:very-short-patch-repair endonuclease